MLGRTTGAVLQGIDARIIEVEVDLAGGLPSIAAVGLPDSAVREGIDRIRSAVRHAGFSLPQRRVVVNLAPADVRKQGASLDLPIAVALLKADDRLPGLDTRPLLFVGELGLDGSLRPVRGVLSMALAARRCDKRGIVVSAENAAEARLVEGLGVIPVHGLADVVAMSRGSRVPSLPPLDARRLLEDEAGVRNGPDLADVRGQPVARRVLEVAAAGGHHLLLVGPPGSGKTLLARRLPGILPALSLEEALQVTRVWSAAGLGDGLVRRRPFRAPHHAISFAGLTGGGRVLRPGELSLASGGVLYLDELTEFRRDALEALRQPLEDRAITVARLHGAATFPAEFTLVASMNPCPCGYLGQPDGRCLCTPRQVQRYQSKISGPLLDRFDLVVEVPPLELSTLVQGANGEGSTVVRGRVEAARLRQRERFGRSGPSCNASMPPAALARHAGLSGEAKSLLLSASRRLGLTGRGFDRVRRVARTLADLADAGEILPDHIAEALQYRRPWPTGEPRC